MNADSKKVGGDRAYRPGDVLQYKHDGVWFRRGGHYVVAKVEGDSVFVVNDRYLLDKFPKDNPDYGVSQCFDFVCSGKTPVYFERAMEMVDFLQRQNDQLVAALEAAKEPLQLFRTHGDWSDHTGVISKVEAAIAAAKDGAA